MTNYQRAMKRLSSINWPDVRREASNSDVILVKEYVRRVALLSQDAGGSITSPLFNPANLFSCMDDAVKNELECFANALKGKVNAYVIAACKCYLMWSFLLDSDEPLVKDYADVFEPLIKLFERGGTFALHRGEIIVGARILPLKDWQSKANNIEYDISDRSLDVADRA